MIDLKYWWPKFVFLIDNLFIVLLSIFGFLAMFNNEFQRASMYFSLLSYGISLRVLTKLS